MMIKKMLLVFLLLALFMSLAAKGEPAQVALAPEAAFFNDAVFVGDSVTNQIRRHRTSMRNEGIEIFGTARFLSAGAYSLYLAGFDRALADQPALLYRGNYVSLAQGLKAMEAKQVYILLGLADDPGYNTQRDVQRYTKVVTRIREALPDIQIMALSLTPITKQGESTKTTQKGIDLFNQRLMLLCEELDMTYVDIATPLKNDQGYLPGTYSNDKKVHLNETGLTILTATLHQFARDQLAREEGR